MRGYLRLAVLASFLVFVGWQAVAQVPDPVERWEYGEFRTYYYADSGLGCSWRLAGGSLFEFSAGQDAQTFLTALNDGTPWPRVASGTCGTVGTELQVLGSRGWEIIQIEPNPDRPGRFIHMKRRLN